MPLYVLSLVDVVQFDIQAIAFRFRLKGLGFAEAHTYVLISLAIDIQISQQHTITIYAQRIQEVLPIVLSKVELNLLNDIGGIKIRFLIFLCRYGAMNRRLYDKFPFGKTCPSSQAETPAIKNSR